MKHTLYMPSHCATAPRPDLVWHYTTAEHLSKILATGAILQATRYIPQNEHPIVWFSKNQAYEATACKGLRDHNGRTATFAEMAASGIARIGISCKTPGLLMWPWLAIRANMASTTRRSLECAAREHGALPHQWCGVLGPVHAAHWVSIQTWSDTAWIEVEVPADSALA